MTKRTILKEADEDKRGKLASHHEVLVLRCLEDKKIILLFVMVLRKSLVCISEFRIHQNRDTMTMTVQMRRRVAGRYMLAPKKTGKTFMHRVDPMTYRDSIG